MIYKIDYSKDAIKVIKKWKKSNKPLFDKLRKVLNSIAETPREGIGHPEAMKGGNNITYSRHITAQDRIVYNIFDDIITVVVIDVEGHYNDK